MEEAKRESPSRGGQHKEEVGWLFRGRGDPGSWQELPTHKSPFERPGGLKIPILPPRPAPHPLAGRAAKRTGEPRAGDSRRGGSREILLTSPGLDTQPSPCKPLVPTQIWGRMLRISFADCARPQASWVQLGTLPRDCPLSSRSEREPRIYRPGRPLTHI